MSTPPAAPAGASGTSPAISVQDKGQRNVIEIPPDLRGELKLVINGHDNQVRIGAGVKLTRCRLDIRGHHCTIDIGQGCQLAGGFVCRSSHTRLLIGDKTTMMGATITMHEPGTIRIGTDCMFAAEVRMDTSDMHSIIDVATGRRINPPGDLEIGEHVWLGFGTYVLKGARIGAHSIVGARAVVSGEVPPNSLAVGVPARVVRSGVSWDRRLLPLSEDD